MKKIIDILIVDDSKTFNNMMRAFFESLEYYNVSQAFCLSQAKEILQNNSIDYIFLDLNLPDGSGVELIDTIQKDFDCKVIVMTGSEDTILRDRIFEKGVIDYFIKTTPVPIIGNCANVLIKNIESQKNTNILTIDDSDFVRTILKKILESKDYNVFEASSAIEGKKIIQDNDIHLILLDLIMPEIDGMSFLEDIKSNKAYHEIPVIVVSADTSRENYSRVLKQGASDFIKKPFIVEEVLLKCDIHIKAFFHNKKVIENEKKILRQDTMISLQKKEIEKQKSIASLVQNIAHHWRQPLSVISTLSSGIKFQLGFEELDKNEIINRMDMIVKNTKYLSKILDDFDATTIKTMKKESIQLSLLIEKILHEKKDFIEKSNIKIVKNISNISIKTYLDEFIHILLSLFNNIQEHGKNTTYIFIDVYEENKMINIKIKDNGKGVKDKDLKKIFEPYFTTSHQSMGKGMGLFIVQKLIKDHFKGKVEAKNVVYSYEDEELSGFEVCIKIPLS